MTLKGEISEFVNFVTVTRLLNKNFASKFETVLSKPNSLQNFHHHHVSSPRGKLAAVALCHVQTFVFIVQQTKLNPLHFFMLPSVSVIIVLLLFFLVIFLLL